MKVLILSSMPLASLEVALLLAGLNPHNPTPEPPTRQTLELDLMYQDPLPRTLEMSLDLVNLEPLLVSMDRMDQEPPAVTLRDLMDQQLQEMAISLEAMKYQIQDPTNRETMGLMMPTIRIPTPKKIPILTRSIWTKKKLRQRRIRFLT